jgi:hypothetical protein
MPAKRGDLLAVVRDVRGVIACDKIKTLEEAQYQVSRVIDESPLSMSANILGERFWKEWKCCNGPQLTALDLTLGHLAGDPDVRYLVVARVFSAPRYPFNADDLWDDVLAICYIIFDDDQGPPDQPKPRWMREWGLRRNRKHVPD